MSNPNDEYDILDILKRHNAEGALNEIAAAFDRFCETYMGSHDEIRKDAFTEVNCYLMKAVIDCRNDDSALRQKIKSIIEGLDEEVEVKDKH